MHASAKQAFVGSASTLASSQDQKRAPFYWDGLADEHRRAFDSAPVAAALEAFVDHFEEGVAVVDRFGCALFLNREAQGIVRGPHLRLANGRLCASAPSGSVALRTVIADCAASGLGGSLRLGADEETLLIAASAFPSGAGADVDRIVLLRLIDPINVRPPTKAALQAQFGLTATEAAFALEMLAGNDLAASAARRSITLNTARVHLRHIFEKTDTRRQAALMRLLLLCPKPIVEQSAPAACR
ncbi:MULTISPECIES: helix-turn-helix transcriptional regulator [unclassified Methylobacterium]|uniref:helix-turn-helix transcriptional regulator n=1 Tax=unclassified Methylobacterium TaxID=2615210 RepID=UPI002269825F|nr:MULTISPECIES: helix-turn-helix transcriptional regulator [unclassified Methylobacterium]